MADTSARGSGTPTPETDAFNERVVNGDETHAPCVHPLGTIDYCEAYGLALDEIGRMERERDEARAALRWIPVAERLPDKPVRRTHYWILSASMGYRSECAMLARWTGEYFRTAEDDIRIYDASHWRTLTPLPAAPQAEGGK